MIAQFIRFCGAGLCGFVIDVGVFTLLVRYGFSAFAALCVSYPCGMFINFFLCWQFVFAARCTMLQAFSRYAAIALFVFFANQLVLPITTGYFPTTPSLARMSAAGCISVAQYLALKIVAFG